MCKFLHIEGENQPNFIEVDVRHTSVYIAALTFAFSTKFG